MPLPDVDASRAVLIGTAAYRTLDPLPTVANNLDGLATLLRDPDLWGLPEEHCSVVLNPSSVDELLEIVRDAAQQATDTLLVYYAGHGLLDQTSELVLTLPGSDNDRMYRSVRYADIRREILDSKSRDKAVILDCCYSGRAFMPAAVSLADQADIEGTWLLTATAKNRLALAPPDEYYTAFTGELIRVLDEGIVDGPELIDTDALYLRVLHKLKAKQRPQPQQRSANRGHVITFARNRAYHGTPPAHEAVPELVDDGPYMRLTPAQLATRIDELRATGQEGVAAAVLASSGYRRPDQEVASIMMRLASLDRAQDVAAVAFAASRRDPNELRSVYEVLVELDQPRLAIGLLKVVATGLPERTARFVAVLDGDGEAVPLLLRAAVADNHGRPQRLIDLLNALYLTQRWSDADLLLAEAQRVLPPHDLAIVADALRDGGRDEQAYQLYGRATSDLVRREPGQIAAIVAALHRGSTPQAAGHLAEQAVAARVDGPPEALAELIAAFETAGLEDNVTDAVAALGAGLPRSVLDEVTRSLRERGCESAAFRLYLAAVTDRPVDDILRLNDSLNEQGRPMDALSLLAHAAQVRSILDLDRMTSEGGNDASPLSRNRRIFAAVAAQEPRRAAALYRLLVERADDRAGQLGTALLKRPAHQIVATVAELIRDEPDLADGLLRAATRGGDRMPRKLAAAAARVRDCRIALRVAVLADTDHLPAILGEIFRHIPEPGAAESQIASLLAALPRRTITEIVTWIAALGQGFRGQMLTRAIADRPVADIVTILAAITRPDSAAPADELLGMVAAQSLLRVADLAGELRRCQERAHLRTLVDEFQAHSSDSPDVFKLASWLWALDERELALRALRDRLWAPEHTIADARATAVAAHLHRFATETERTKVAFPNLLLAPTTDELSRSYPLVEGETCLLVLAPPRTQRLTPILFTDRAVHYAGGSTYAYTELLTVRVAADRRTSVVFTGGPSDEPKSWDLPTDAAVTELVGLLATIRHLVQQFEHAPGVRPVAHLPARPVPPGVPRYDLEGEVSS